MTPSTQQRGARYRYYDLACPDPGRRRQAGPGQARSRSEIENLVFAGGSTEFGEPQSESIQWTDCCRWRIDKITVKREAIEIQDSRNRTDFKQAMFQKNGRATNLNPATSKHDLGSLGLLLRSSGQGMSHEHNCDRHTWDSRCARCAPYAIAKARRWIVGITSGKVKSSTISPRRKKVERHIVCLTPCLCRAIDRAIIIEGTRARQSHGHRLAKSSVPTPAPTTTLPQVKSEIANRHGHRTTCGGLWGLAVRGCGSFVGRKLCGKG